MSLITDTAKEEWIEDMREISMLEHFFTAPEVTEELEKAEKFRIYRYLTMIIVLSISTIGLIYLGSLGIIQVEMGDSGKYRDSTATDGVFWAIVWGSIFGGIVVALYRSKIEWAIKEHILTKLAKELYSKLEYDASGKYAFGDLDFLRSKWFLNSYDRVKKIEDSIGFRIEEDQKSLIAQGYELETTETRGSGKNRRTVTTNHCYLMKIRFPSARIPLEKTLFIRTDENETIINNSIGYIILGAFIWFFIGIFVSTILDSGFVILICIIGGAISGYLLRKRSTNTNRVQLEDSDFEKLYDVQCEDQIGSRMIITPAFMDRLVRFSAKSKHRFEFIYEANCFYIKWNLSGSYLEINTWMKITKNMRTFILWYSQMKEILAFIFDMRLLYFSKTTASIEVQSTWYESMDESIWNTRKSIWWFTSSIPVGWLLNLISRR